VNTSEELATDIGEKKPGDTISVELERGVGNGKYKRMTVKATLGQRPNSIPNPNTPEG
jgi:S1-C subfamily serine protease